MKTNFIYVMYVWFFLTILVRLNSGENLIELNHELNAASAYWPTGSAPFNKSVIYEGFTKDGYWYSSYKFCSGEHTGTHLDAPKHFNENGWGVEEIPLERLFAPAVVIDIREKVKKNAIYQLSAGDVVEWVEEHGIFPNNSVVLVNTGWSNRYNDKFSYFGHATDPTKFIFPGIGVGATQTLIGYETSSGVRIIGIGIDTPSIDYGPSKTFESHQVGAASNVYFLENLKDLEKLPPTGAQLVVMPMKITGGSGSPCRVVAQIDNACGGSRSLHCSYVVVVISILLAIVS